MTSPLSPEAVAQMVADLTHTDGPDGEMSMLYRGVIADALTTLAAENATLRAERDSYEASAVEAHRVSRAHQSDAILWQYNAAVGDVQPLLVTIWKQRKAAENVARLAMDASQRKETELATLRASEAAALERVTRMEAALQFYSDISGWNQPQVKTRDGLISVEYENQASKIQRDRGKIARAALTPTADKEPT